MRKIIIGDVHGCIEEFMQLLELIGFNRGIDQLFQVGDLINKGPDSKACFDLLMELGGKAVLGNHEYHLIRDARGEQVKKKWVAKFKEDWGADFYPYLKEIQSWPYFYRDEDFLMVHAGLVPNVKPEDTDPFILTNIRTWDGVGEKLWNKNDPKWFDLYKGQKKIIFGHWAALEGVQKNNVIGLDTGCVYGKKLTALVLPEWKIVSVDAKKVYCPIS